MINLFTVRSFCKEDICLIENYDKAKGRVLTVEHKNKISKSLKGKRLGCSPKNKGLKCFTNGIINVYAKECPDGFIKGTIRNLSNMAA